MKTKNNIFTFILASLAAVIFLSCDNPISLGNKLDIEGPVVSIISPVQRQSVPAQFEIEGTATDLTGVDKLVMRASTSNGDFPRQWRYSNSGWEISEDHGVTWLPFANAQWAGDAKNVQWKISVDMVVNGLLASEGEYTFNVQAWDKAGFSDDNSFKAVVLIIDLDPPKVNITNPFLYRGINPLETEPLKKLHEIDDSSDAWKEPANLGKFLTQEFSLKWQIEDMNDVWSIDIRFYDHETVIDNNPETVLPETYIYRYYKNLPPPPFGANPNDYVKPNGSVTVPDLDKPAGVYDGGGEIKHPVTEKTTIKVVAVCYDAAGNPNQEKTLGYYIYWPKANWPWIVFTEGMAPPDAFYNQPLKNIEEKVFMIYPGRSIKATAFQAHGVKEVKYSLYKMDTAGDKLNSNIIETVTVDAVVPNTSYGGSYSTIFPWELLVPPFTGYYIIKASSYSSQGVSSGEYVMLFRVHDITFPDFIEPPKPIASEPLFKAIENNTITISGMVSDATKVVSLCLVWINPESTDFAAMSQLAYFRDKNYAGWLDALSLLLPGENMLEIPAHAYDKNNHLNRLWKFDLTPKGIDYDTNRQLFSYSQIINLENDLNISTAKQPLKSQIFLLRAENPDGKCTIITYAPQGDTSPPVITISNVAINDKTYAPSSFDVIDQFEEGDKITIDGTWREDSLEKLDLTAYFKNNFNVTVCNQPLSSSALDLTKDTDTEGKWKITTYVGGGVNQIPKEKLKDTLVISAEVKDIGGNKAEAGSSWLIKSDTLRLMRISSETLDATYRAGNEIIIFLEFSKPVKLTNGGTPELILNSAAGNAARAVYIGQTDQNSRQYFKYTVAPGHNTSTYLNVIGLYSGTAFTTTTPYNTNNYAFSWSRGAGNEYEEVRLTMQAGKDGLTKEGTGYFVRTLPTASTGDDYKYTLIAGKHISVDTVAPTVTSVAANTSQGHYKSGDIYITVNFSKEIKVGAAIPALKLQIGSVEVLTDTANVRVNGKAITFMYRIKPGDTSNGNQIAVTGYSGDILDLAENPLGGVLPNTTLTGLYVDTILFDAAPTVRVLSAANTANVVTNAKGTGDSSFAGSTVLTSLYNQNLWLAIQGDVSKGAHKLYRLEYSINNGISWIEAGNVANNPFSLSQKGENNIVARQTDRAGNVSPTSKAVTFTWDPGSLISRISSTSANGIYTNTTGSNGGTRTDSISITVYFRKQVRFSTATPRITLNVLPATVTADASYSVGALVNELTFTYTVGANHNTPSGQRLDVTGFNLNGSTAQDEFGLTVNDYLDLPASGSLLKDLKDITVQTGALTASGNPVFNNSMVTGGGLAADGSYNTALVVTFSRNIIKGEGNITIIQDPANYRLPAVLTESQFAKYSNIANVNNYYSRGSNGYNYTSATVRGADTTTKYILRYDVDTATVGVPNASGTPEQIIAEAFRQAEKVAFSVNAQAVRVSGNQLIVELTGTNALQVPGASYQVSYSQGFVQDSLNNRCAVVTSQSVDLGGIAKPFIRINKKQDTITTAVASTSQPFLVAAQPFQAGVRMDCRTPGSTIYYFINQAGTNTNVMNWRYNANPASDGPNDLNTPATPVQPSDPQTVTTNRQTWTPGTTTPLSIGTDNEYQGLQWYGRVKSNKGSDWSVNSEEMAFKTVVTYQINAMSYGDNGMAPNGDTTANGTYTGDQIWIRGGDAIGSSNIPGFPLTWDDTEHSKAKDDKKRAGIKLFTKTAGGNTDIRTTSTWQWITWDINVDTYADIILGRDRDSEANEAWQYGPRQWAAQRAGWTSYKENFRILPGKHRWLVSDNPTGGNTKGVLNFSGTLSSRAAYAGADITYQQPTTP